MQTIKPKTEQVMQHLKQHKIGAVAEELVTGMERKLKQWVLV